MFVSGPFLRIYRVCRHYKNMTLIAGPYLIVATDNFLVGSIDGHAVYTITNFDVIPFSKSTIHLSDVQVNSS